MVMQFHENVKGFGCKKTRITIYLQVYNHINEIKSLFISLRSSNSLNIDLSISLVLYFHENIR